MNHISPIIIAKKAKFNTDSNHKENKFVFKNGILKLGNHSGIYHITSHHLSLYHINPEIIIEKNNTINTLGSFGKYVFKNISTSIQKTQINKVKWCVEVNICIIILYIPSK